MQITPANVDKFVGHLGQVPRTEQGSFLARRIRGALEHFKHRNNVSEVQSYLATQADIEASAVDSGYTLLRVFIWVCPILGFIGTVLGIGWAVTDLAKALPEAPSATAPAPAAAPPAGGAPGQAGLGDKLLDGMRLVTDGLATAFDTTLLGLVCVVILMFPTEALKKIEYGMLDRVQGFANESLLRRMAEGQAADKDAMPEVVQRALDTAFKEHQRWLTQWQAQVAKLGNVIGAEFEAHFSNLQEKLAKVESGRVGDFNTAVRRVEELFGQVEQMTASWQKLGSGDFKTALSAVAQLHQALAANTGALEKVLGQQGALLDKYSASDLNGVLRSLSEAVTQLSENRSAAAAANHQPLTPRHAAARRSGLFGRILGRDRE
jgi:biopolymer transport protein ExbB/TolQ